MSGKIQAYEVLKSRAKTAPSHPIVLLVDHASAFIPQEFKNLGLSDMVLSSHVAIDIGAKHMALRLQDKLGADAIYACFSRLLIDPNRELWREDLIPQTSDGHIIVGNKKLNSDQKQYRIDHLYNPYHQAAEAVIGTYLEQGLKPWIIGVHSFTPEMNGFDRPWDIGFMWNKDQRLGLFLAKEFEKLGKCVGHNLPYGGDGYFHSMMTHGDAHGLCHTQIEVRQDLVSNPQDAQNWADMIAAAVLKFDPEK